jgi:hypothetical protein
MFCGIESNLKPKVFNLTNAGFRLCCFTTDETHGHLRSDFLNLKIKIGVSNFLITFFGFIYINGVVLHMRICGQVTTWVTDIARAGGGSVFTGKNSLSDT